MSENCVLDQEPASGQQRDLQAGLLLQNSENQQQFQAGPELRAVPPHYNRRQEQVRHKGAL